LLRDRSEGEHHLFGVNDVTFCVRYRDGARQAIESEDPHAGIGNLQEAEVTRVRTLRGGWRWALVVATAATILLCINQQFSLRFFIDYTQLNTEYFYLLIALMLPFTFLIFPGTETAPLDRIPWYDLPLFVATFAASIWLMLNVRKAAQFGWESDGAPQNVIAAGLVMWFVLMEALRRTGGWSPAAQRAPFTVYPLFAEASWLGPFRACSSRWMRPRPMTCCPARACSAFTFMPSPTR
jgi:TRAP-type uncharacterized transport system fused permease subunit